MPTWIGGWRIATSCGSSFGKGQLSILKNAKALMQVLDPAEPE